MMARENQVKAIKQLNLLKLRSSKMRLAAEKWNNPWKTLIAIAMSAQSRDETTITIATALFEKYPTLKELANANYDEVLFVLRSLNYNRTKASNIIACAKMLLEKYHGKVPLNFDELIALPGVGRKTANVFLSEMGLAAIGVDTHAAYISKKLLWTKNKSPEKIERDLKLLFSKKYWKHINPTLVRFGKTYTSRKKKDKMLDEISNIR
ncbi:MAG: endonuclease III [archaeon]